MAKKKFPKEDLPESVMDYFRATGATGGKIGGKAKVPKGFAALTPKQRAAMGKKAAKAKARKRKAG